MWIGGKKKSFAFFASFVAKKIKFKAARPSTLLSELTRSCGGAEDQKMSMREWPTIPSIKLRGSASPREIKSLRFRFGTWLEWRKADASRNGSEPRWPRAPSPTHGEGNPAHSKLKTFLTASDNKPCAKPLRRSAGRLPKCGTRTLKGEINAERHIPPHFEPVEKSVDCIRGDKRGDDDSDDQQTQ